MVYFELSHDKKIIQRTCYSLYDWMNDVGGFAGFVQLFFMLMLPLVEVTSLEKYLVSHLYKRHSTKPIVQPETDD